MPQLHCYVPEEIATRISTKAAHAHLSVSKYLAQLIQKDVSNAWPENYFDLYGACESDPLTRHKQGELETREAFK